MIHLDRRTTEREANRIGHTIGGRRLAVNFICYLLFVILFSLILERHPYMCLCRYVATRRLEQCPIDPGTIDADGDRLIASSELSRAI